MYRGYTLLVGTGHETVHMRRMKNIAKKQNKTQKKLETGLLVLLLLLFFYDRGARFCVETLGSKLLHQLLRALYSQRQPLVIPHLHATFLSQKLRQMLIVEGTTRTCNRYITVTVTMFSIYESSSLAASPSGPSGLSRQYFPLKIHILSQSLIQ